MWLPHTMKFTVNYWCLTVFFKSLLIIISWSIGKIFFNVSQIIYSNVPHGRRIKYKNALDKNYHINLSKFVLNSSFDDFQMVTQIYFDEQKHYFGH